MKKLLFLAVLFFVGMLLLTGEGETFGVTFTIKLVGVILIGAVAILGKVWNIEKYLGD